MAPYDGTPRAEAGTEAPAVEGVLNYIVPGDEKPKTYITEPGIPTQRRSRYDGHAFAIRDARALAAPATLDREGFALEAHASAVADFYDSDEVERVYYPEAAELVKRATGASEVRVFDHNVRNSDEAARTERRVREPVRVVHNDYTVTSGPQRVRDLVGGAEAEELVRGRFAVINVWRPIRGPLRTMPLAICDARSIAPADLVPTDLVYGDRTGEVYQTRWSANHRWFYYPALEASEAILIKCYDSAEDGTARFTCHTAFADPTTPADAIPRESIEARTLAFFRAGA